jgi:hypothetical protein
MISVVTFYYAEQMHGSCSESWQCCSINVDSNTRYCCCCCGRGGWCDDVVFGIAVLAAGAHCVAQHRIARADTVNHRHHHNRDDCCHHIRSGIISKGCIIQDSFMCSSVRYHSIACQYFCRDGVV